MPNTVRRRQLLQWGAASGLPQGDIMALLLLPPRRVAYLLGFLVCAGLMGWALWLQYGLDLEPCPLCVFQRICVIATGIVFLVAFIQDPHFTKSSLQ